MLLFLIDSRYHVFLMYEFIRGFLTELTFGTFFPKVRNKNDRNMFIIKQHKRRTNVAKFSKNVIKFTYYQKPLK